MTQSDTARRPQSAQSISYRATYLSLVVGDSGHHDLGLVIHCKDHLGHTGLRQSFDLVAQDGLIAEVYEGLGHGKCHRSKPGAEASHENQSFYLSLFCSVCAIFFFSSLFK